MFNYYTPALLGACVNSSSSRDNSGISINTSDETSASINSFSTSSRGAPTIDLLHKSSGWDSLANTFKTGWKSLKKEATQFFNSKAWEAVKSAPMVICAAAVLIGMFPVTLLILGISYFCFNNDRLPCPPK